MITTEYIVTEYIVAPLNVASTQNVAIDAKRRNTDDKRRNVR